MPRIRSRRRGPSIAVLICALGLLGSGTVGLGLISAEPGKDATATLSATRVTLHAPPAAIALVRHEMALLDPATNGGFAPAPFGRSAPLRGWFDGNAEPQVVQAAREAALETAEPPLPPEAALRDTAEADNADGASANNGSTAPEAPAREIPLPVNRPPSNARLATPQPRQLASRAVPAPAVVAAPPSDGRTLLERMFGAPVTAPAANPALAYATPGDTGGFFGGRTSTAAGNGTAVYNIAKHVVTLPDGTQLEAHSGLGVHLDDPGSVAERMRGATPPTIYELTPREAPFHGVRALRLTPLLEGTTFGRGGLLAHTFMLGPRGDSNGCVVFRNYPAFLAAYESGRIRRLLVVAGT